LVQGIAGILDIGGQDDQPPLALLQGFNHPGQVVFHFFRQDLTTLADGTLDAVPAHFGDEIGRVLEIEFLEGFGKGD
jgi:hypothetical protein